MIMGHEAAHALREHARERMGKNAATQLGAGLISQLFGLGNLGNTALNIGGQLLTLRFSREDESEADLVGMELAGRSGYDPRSGVTLWQKMIAAAKGAPPQFLSTHPAGPTRIKRHRGQPAARRAALRARREAAAALRAAGDGRVDARAAAGGGGRRRQALSRPSPRAQVGLARNATDKPRRSGVANLLSLLSLRCVGPVAAGDAERRRPALVGDGAVVAEANPRVAAGWHCGQPFLRMRMTSAYIHRSHGPRVRCRFVARAAKGPAHRRRGRHGRVGASDRGAEDGRRALAAVRRRSRHANCCRRSRGGW